MSTNDKQNSLKTNLIFSGYYGMSNVGDDCFCSIAGWGAVNFWNAGKLFYLSSKIPKMPVPGTPLFSRTQKFHGQNRIGLLYHLAKTPCLVFAGGSIFHGHEGWERELIFSFNKIRKLKLGAIDVSLGPYRSEAGRNKVTNMLKELSFLVLRDGKSYDEACLLKLPYTPILGFDLAGLLPSVYGKFHGNITSNGKPVLGVIPCHFERYSKNNIENEKRRDFLFLDTLKKVTKKISCIIRIFTFNAHPKNGDELYSKHLFSALSEHCDVELQPYCEDPELIWKQISCCNAVFSIRLHGGIFACMAKVPFALVEYHKKCSDFLDYIDQPDKWRVGDMKISSDEASSKITDMLRNSSSYPIDTIGLETKALLNFKGLKFIY